MGYRARGRMPKSPILAFYLDSFKAAAGEGAVLELKLRLLAGKVPTLRKYAHQQNLGNIEDELATHFGDALSVAEKDMLRLCRQLRNKVLHSDFYAARGKLGELGIDTQSGGVKMIPLPVATVEEFAKKIAGARAGTEGTNVADTLSTDEGSVYGWFSKRAPPAISTRRATHSKGQGRSLIGWQVCKRVSLSTKGIILSRVLAGQAVSPFPQDFT